MNKKKLLVTCKVFTSATVPWPTNTCQVRKELLSALAFHPVGEDHYFTAWYEGISFFVWLFVCSRCSLNGEYLFFPIWMLTIFPWIFNPNLNHGYDTQISFVSELSFHLRFLSLFLERTGNKRFTHHKTKHEKTQSRLLELGSVIRN